MTCTVFLWRSYRCLPMIIIFASSACRVKCVFGMLSSGRSFMKQLNKVGDEHEPWGILRFTFCGSDLTPSITTWCSLSETYDYIQLFGISPVPRRPNVVTSRSWHTISNARLIWKNNTMIDSNWFNVSWIWFTECVEWFGLNPF